MDVKDTWKKAVPNPVYFHSTYGRKGDKIAQKFLSKKQHNIPFLSLQLYQPPEQKTYTDINFTSHSRSYSMLGCFKVYSGISSLKFNYTWNSAKRTWKNTAFSNLMISVLRWKIICSPWGLTENPRHEIICNCMPCTLFLSIACSKFNIGWSGVWREGGCPVILAILSSCIY